MQLLARELVLSLAVGAHAVCEDAVVTNPNALASTIVDANVCDGVKRITIASPVIELNETLKIEPGGRVVISGDTGHETLAAHGDARIFTVRGGTLTMMRGLSLVVNGSAENGGCVYATCTESADSGLTAERTYLETARALYALRIMSASAPEVRLRPKEPMREAWGARAC